MDTVTFRPEMMGTIYLTKDINFVKSVPDNTIKIISLDEDNRKLNPNDPNVIVGTCLLPPVEALIAEVDGDEDLYNLHYMDYLNSPGIQEFIAAIIAALYNKKQLLLYAPQFGENMSIQKLIDFMWSLYGIGIGIVGQTKCIYDPRCIPIWLNMMYLINTIDAREFMYNYPDGAQINTNIMYKLMSEVRPLGESYDDRVNSIMRLMGRIKKNPKTITPVYDAR